MTFLSFQRKEAIGDINYAIKSKKPCDRIFFICLCLSKIYNWQCVLTDVMISSVEPFGEKEFKNFVTVM